MVSGLYRVVILCQMPEHEGVHQFTSWSAHALEPGFSLKQACAMVFSSEVAKANFSHLISLNLAVHPTLKFLLLTENNKMDT